MYILEALQNYFQENNQQFTISQTALKRMKKIKKVEDEYWEKHHRLPLMDEYVAETGLKKKNIEELLTVKNFEFVNVSKEIGNEENENNSSVAESVADITSEFENDVEASMIAEQCCAIIDEVLEGTDANVIKMSYGFTDKTRTSLKSRQQVADELNISYQQCENSLYRGFLILQDNEQMRELLAACI